MTENVIYDGAASDQAAIDKKNSEFWDELCGSQLAKTLGIEDDSPESLAKFDDWYFDFYPYLFKHIPFEELKGKKVLEIGLGYGTVSQKIAESGAEYCGLDIAAGPVHMASKRLGYLGVTGDVRQGSILEPPFEEGTFDWVVAIGCLHHTGNLSKAVGRVLGLLKDDGQAMIMVYNATSYRQWTDDFKGTLARAMSSPSAYQKSLNEKEQMRGSYDSNAAGDAAPQTEYVTARELKYLCRSFSKCTVTKENMWTEGVLQYLSRATSCTLLGPFVGLDLYCHLKK